MCNDLIPASPAACQHIPSSGIEVIGGIPGVGHLLLRAASVFHQKAHLVAEVTVADAVHIAELGLLRPNEQIILPVVAVEAPPDSVAAAGDAVLRPLPAGRQTVPGPPNSKIFIPQGSREKGSSSASDPPSNRDEAAG